MREATELDFRRPELRDALLEDYEVDDDGKVVRKDRFQTAIERLRDFDKKASLDELVTKIYATLAVVKYLGLDSLYTWVEHKSDLDQLKPLVQSAMLKWNDTAAPVCVECGEAKAVALREVDAAKELAAKDAETALEKFMRRSAELKAREDAVRMREQAEDSWKRAYQREVAIRLEAEKRVAELTAAQRAVDDDMQWKPAYLREQEIRIAAENRAIELERRLAPQVEAENRASELPTTQEDVAFDGNWKAAYLREQETRTSAENQVIELKREIARLTQA